MEGIPYTILLPQKDDLLGLYDLIYQKLMLAEAKKEEDWKVHLHIFEKERDEEETKKNEEPDKVGLCIEPDLKLGLAIFDSQTSPPVLFQQC